MVDLSHGRFECEIKMDASESTGTVVSGAAGEIHCLIPASELARRVRELAQQISGDYAGQSPLVVGVLHGAYVFMADLLRHMTIPVRCGFVMVSSYDDDTVTSGKVKLHLDLRQSAEGEHILLVDDALRVL